MSTDPTADLPDDGTHVTGPDGRCRGCDLLTAASLPAEVMLAALVDRGTLRSPETVDPIAWTIHVDVPTEATEAETDRLFERVAKAAHGAKRGKWDPFIHAHALDCVASDHCAAPRPNGPPYPRPEVAP